MNWFAFWALMFIYAALFVLTKMPDDKERQ